MWFLLNYYNAVKDVGQIIGCRNFSRWFVKMVDYMIKENASNNSVAIDSKMLILFQYTLTINALEMY